MKKVSSLMILLLAGVMMFVSCSYAGNSGNGGGNSNFVPPKDNITIDGITYEKTGEVQLMQTAQIVIGSDDYNQYHKGAFPKGRIVKLSPFIISKYEVTQELYEAVMTGQKVTIGNQDRDLSANPSYFTSLDFNFKSMFPDESQKYRPVEGVTWFDACYFCNVLSNKESLTKAYEITVTEVNQNGNIIKASVTPVSGANGYRLPTETEWEYAARGGAVGVADRTFANYWSGATTINYSAGENDDISSVAWYRYNNTVRSTHQVGKKASNAVGIFDMTGNVEEWCYDYYCEFITRYDDEFIVDGIVINPSGPSEAQSQRVYRGGYYYDFAPLSAVSFRCNYEPKHAGSDVGFRVCRNAE